MFVRLKSVTRIWTTNCRKLHSSDAGREYEAREAIRGVIEPISQQSLIPLGLLQRIRIVDKSVVKVDLKIPVPGYPFHRHLACEMERSLKSLYWVDSVVIESMSGVSSKNQALTTGLSHVKYIIGVSSCKGGVGKSTVAVNVALALALKGLRVGLLDADVYGPSIHAMLRTKDNIVRKSRVNDKFILPLEGPLGLKVLSFAHVNPKASVLGAGGKTAALIRGPIVSRVITQLLAMTEWGELDYLIVDMPPGTGDIQITLCQTVSLAGAIIVTTPHTLALVDAKKGVEMFKDLQVPTLAVVENMAFFKGDDGKVYYPFGYGGKEKIFKNLGISLNESIDEVPYHSFPISPYLSQISASDKLMNEQELNDPAIVSRPNSDISLEYKSLVDEAIILIYKLEISSQLTPQISFDDAKGIIILRYFTAESAQEFKIPGIDLRRRSPVTGAIEREIEDKNIKPLHFEMKGNYGVSILWSDGHYADIYPFAVLRSIAEEYNNKN